MSAATRFTTTSDPKFVTFIAAQTQHFVGRDSDWSPTDNTCPVVEGLASAARILSARNGADDDLVRRIRTRIDQEMTKNRTLQIRPGADHLDLPGGGSLSSPKLAGYAGAFLAGADEPFTRIDYTAHCISAFIEMSVAGGTQ
jgi:hypothetical protein